MLGAMNSVKVIPVSVRSGASVEKKLWCSFAKHSIDLAMKLDELIKCAENNDQDSLLFVCDELQLVLSDECVRRFVMARAVESEYVRERMQYYLEKMEDLTEMVQAITELYVPLDSEETKTLLNTAVAIERELVFILGVGFDMLAPVSGTLEVNEIVLEVCHNSVAELEKVFFSYMRLWTEYRPHFPSLELPDDQLDLLYEALGAAAYEVVENVDDLTMEVANMLISGEMTAEQLLERRE